MNHLTRIIPCLAFPGNIVGDFFQEGLLERKIRETEELRENRPKIREAGGLES